MGRQVTTRAYDNSYSGGAISNKAYDAAPDGTTSLKKVSFGVFGYHSAYQTLNAWGNWNATTNSINKAANFMYNEHVTWSTANPADQWVYSPVKYWPNGIDTANAANDPSNTATEQGPQYLSFFAYAPYVGLSDGSDITTGNPTGVTTAVPTTENASGYGIVAMSKNNETSDIQLKYKFGAAADESSAIDMLWGLRGQNTYSETDGENNTITTLTGNDYNTDLTKQTVDEKVKFLFKHALARVGGSTSSSTAAGSNQICGFKVVVDVDKNDKTNSTTATDHSSQLDYFALNFDNEITLVTIKEVKIRDQYTYSQESGSTISSTRSDFLTEGWFNIMKGTWSTTASNETTHPNGVTYSVEAKNNQTVDNTTPYALNEYIKEPTTAPTSTNITSDKWSYGDDYGVDLSAKNLFADENVPGLLLIPGTGNNTLYVTVDYIVRTVDTKLSTQFTNIEQVITNKVVLDGSILKPNQYYTIIMHLGLTSVKFEAVVSNWQEKSDSNVDENGEEQGGSTVNKESIWLPSNVVAARNISVSAPAAAGDVKVVLDGMAIGSYTSSNTAVIANGTATAGRNELTATLSANTTNQPKVTTVTITDSATPTANVYTITITQAADATYTLTPTVIGQAASSTGTITVGGVTVSSVTATTTPSGLTSSVSGNIVTYTANSANDTGDVKTYDGIVLTISDGTNNYEYTTSITQAKD